MEDAPAITTIEKISADVKDIKTDIRDIRTEGRQRGEAITRVEKQVAVHEEKIANNTSDIKDTRLLVWKILGIVAGGAVVTNRIVDAFF